MKATTKIVLTIISILVLLVIVLVLIKSLSKEKEDTFVTHDILVQQIEDLGNLEVVKYNIQDVVHFEKKRSWLPNSKTSLMVGGEVIACVDLTKIGPDDIFTDKDSVSLCLPIPEICHYKIDHSRSKVYNVDYGLWETAQLVDEAYAEAENQLYKTALNMGIAKQSRQNAIQVLTPILRGLGFKRIEITFKAANTSLSQDSETYQIKNVSKK